MAAAVRIGCSGWHYKHWAGPFYPAKLPPSKMLAFYCEHFDTVELNNSFYRLPAPETFAAWRAAVPAGFLFAVKANRYITHSKKLKDPEQALERMFASVDMLGDKLGPVLFQLPPQWSADPARLTDFLRVLPAGHDYSFEFRHPSWNSEEVFAVLRRYNAAYCQYHLAGYLTPAEITADFTYVRLHGPGGRYQGSYNDAELRSWADRIGTLQRSLRAIYVYFDNDEAGHAPRNALRLRQILEL